VNEVIAHDFQERYLRGERGALSGLYAECRHLTEALAKAYCKRYGLYITDERMEDTVTVALSSVLSRYRNPEYKIRNFYQVFNIEVVHQLSNHRGPKAKMLDGFVALETIPEQAGAEGKPAESKRGYFKDILSGPNGKRIIVDLWRYRVYREAVLSIDGYCTRGFIRINAGRLAHIWRVMHGKGTYHV
jgi:hypothetical protein